MECMAAYHTNLTYAMCRKIEMARSRAEAMGEKLLRVGPSGALKTRKVQLVYAGERMEQAMRRHLLQKKHRLEVLAGRLHGVSPAARLSGGYAFVATDAKRPLVSVDQVQVDDRLHITLVDGLVTATVEKTEKEAIKWQKQ